MPTPIEQWACDTCRAQYRTFEEASMCEVGHIVSAADEGFKADLRRILPKENPRG